MNSVSDERDEASARAVKAISVGIGCFAVGAILTFSPLVWNLVWGERFPYNKYFVVVGVIGVGMFISEVASIVGARI